MLGTKERNDVTLRQERANEFAPLYNNNEYRNDYSFRGTDNYYGYSNEQTGYAQKYANIDFYNDQYQCSANENVFRPIELSDITTDIKPQKKQKAKSKINIGTKGKILIGVYAALVVLIIAMLLINAIPAVNAQSEVTEPVAKEAVTAPASNQEVQEILGQNGASTKDSATNGSSNWFESFCDNISNLFN